MPSSQRRRGESVLHWQRETLMGGYFAIRGIKQRETPVGGYFANRWTAGAGDGRVHRWRVHRMTPCSGAQACVEEKAGGEVLHNDL